VNGLIRTDCVDALLAAVADRAGLLLGAPLVSAGLLGGIMADAVGQERPLIMLTGSATVPNLTTNLVAMPSSSPAGAAWTTLATEVSILAGI
jgi:hypothetical protein